MSPLEDNYDLGDHEMNDFLTKQKSKDRLDISDDIIKLHAFTRHQTK